MWIVVSVIVVGWLGVLVVDESVNKDDANDLSNDAVHSSIITIHLYCMVGVQIVHDETITPALITM